MLYQQTPVKKRDMDWQLVARYFTVKSTDFFYSVASYSPVAMVTDICHYLTYDSRGARHTVYAMLLSNYK